MAKNLVIVESPAKAKTINKFIGKDYVVKASVGHVRDLPKSELGVDEETFEPTYEVLEGKQKVVSELQAAAKKAEAVYIASDPDREGEAIGWHVMNLLGNDSKKVRRILFHEITKNAVRKAIDHPTEIDMNKVNAQQARRVLDRLVGYKLSPLLWDKVRRGLSAGRVQSVAMKMIVDREEEIKKFVPQEYWTFGAKLEANNPPPFIAKLSKVEGKKAEVGNEQDARKIESALKSGLFAVETITRKEKKKSAAPPFITSTLQRTAYNRFKWPVKRTMQIAQKLYEGKELGPDGFAGLITYMRTDSVRVSNEAIEEVRQYISTKYGADILPEQPNVYKVKKAAQAQEAHEAVRPTSLEFDPERIKDFLTREEYNLYKLIWERFVASQMKPALFDVTDIDIQNGPYTLREWVRLVRAFAVHFGLRRPLVVGHSLGAAVAVGIPLWHQMETRGIVLLDGDALSAGGPGSWVSDLLVGPWVTSAYRIATGSNWIVRRALRDAAGPHHPAFTHAFLDEWKRPSKARRRPLDN